MIISKKRHKKRRHNCIYNTFIKPSIILFLIHIINHINSLHSKLKIWMYRFKGVSTKFLSNYMAWYKWLESFNDDKEIIRTKNMLIHSVIPFIDTKIKGYKGKIAEFI